MTFWQIFWPVFAALLSSFVITETFHFGISYYMLKKQDKARKELEAKIARGEVDPMSMMFGGYSPAEFDLPLPTASGEKLGSEASHGQYL